MSIGTSEKRGTPVMWHFREGVEYGYIESFDGREYTVRQVNNFVVHPGDGPRVGSYKHLPAALTIVSRARVEAAAQEAHARREKEESAHARHEQTEAHKMAVDFKPWAKGTKVSWHYRSAIGHGTIAGVHKLGTSHDTTEYSIDEHDHHPGEPAVVYHYGRALTRE